jgi:hypothetical protein
MFGSACDAFYNVICIVEDEAAAQSLNVVNESGTSSGGTTDIPDLKEIMEMEMALASLKNEQKVGLVSSDTFF